MLLQPRLVLLLILTGGLVTSMVTRTPIILDVIRDRNSLYRELPDNLIENIYTLKLINQSNHAREFSLTVDGVDGIALDGVPERLSVDGGGVLSLPVRARAHRDDAYGIIPITFTVTALDDADDLIVEDSRFLGPTP